MQILRQIVKSPFSLKNRFLISQTKFNRRIYMGSGVSFPSEQEALAAGVTQEQIDEHKKKLSAAAKTVGLPEGAVATPFLPGPPTAAVASSPCALGEEPVKCKLVQKTYASLDARLLTFSLPESDKPLNLPTCACILALAKPSDSSDLLVRPYTPVSTNATLGTFDLLVKVYENGKMSQHLDSLTPGEGEIEFKHIPFNVKIQYPFGKAKIGMLCGGTGVAPMIQALHMILGSKEDKTAVSMLYGSRTADTILGKECLEQWAAAAPSRLQVTHVLSHEPGDSAYIGARGFIGRELIEKHMPAPGENGMIFVCGPTPMYEALCGGRDKKEVTGLLKEMGYADEEVYKF